MKPKFQPRCLIELLRLERIVPSMMNETDTAEVTTMTTLHFECRGQWFEVDEKGRIKGNGLAEHSDGWLFLGVSMHHWSNSIDIGLGSALLNPHLIVGGLVWDKDHGTTRRWGGQYAGKLPRVTNAYTD